jgi:hypothetical protein
MPQAADDLGHVGVRCTDRDSHLFGRDPLGLAGVRQAERNTQGQIRVFRHPHRSRYAEVDCRMRIWRVTVV